MGSLSFLLLFVGIFVSAPAAQAVNVDVVTKYITTEVTTLEQDESFQLIGYLCGQMKDNGINVTVVLNNNPYWIAVVGVVKFYVVDAANKTAKDALCTNVDKQGVPHAGCFVPSWPSTGDLFVKGQNGPVDAVSFSLDAELVPKTDKKNWKQSPESDQLEYSVSYPEGGIYKSDPAVTTIYLTEVILLSAAQKLPRLSEAYLKFTFCPTPVTGTRYTVTSTVFGSDGESSWVQYICDKSPCEPSDTTNMVAHDGRQLPSNTVNTPSGRWTTLYATVVCWGGPFDPATKAFVGHFNFNAIIGS
ncbi:uncharacterized protein LOC117301444 [Asterias rubens]|uniref:uncharacterized protein LOC117301444 n=1 Tax=Asterias rubens TaxID=7604 RepID=UPI001455D9A7|nr:uncharacterized protein LOC117301444 [Asterias rubens]